MMIRGICHLCAEEAQLVDSHIFPEFFYAGTYDETHQCISVTDHPLHRPRPVQKGFTERLLCLPCDNELSAYEAYSAGLLTRLDGIAPDPGSAGIIVDNVDFHLFRLFGLSLIWRAHIASIHMFRQVSLGPHAERIRSMLRSKRSGAPHEYGFAIGKVTGLDTHGQTLIGPVRSRYNERRAYHFTARGYEWVFVVSSDSSGLEGAFPFIGTTAVLYVPFIEQDKAQLFRRLRHAFPRALAG